MTPTPKQISEKVEELKALLVPYCDNQIDNLKHDNSQLQTIREVLSLHWNNKKLSELDTTEKVNCWVNKELWIKSINLRIIVKHFIQLHEKYNILYKEVYELREIKNKYENIVHSIKES